MGNWEDHELESFVQNTEPLYTEAEALRGSGDTSSAEMLYERARDEYFASGCGGTLDPDSFDWSIIRLARALVTS